MHNIDNKFAVAAINHASGIPEPFDTLTFFDGGSGRSDLLSASTSFRALDLRVCTILRTGSDPFSDESTDCILLILF